MAHYRAKLSDLELESYYIHRNQVAYRAAKAYLRSYWAAVTEDSPPEWLVRVIAQTLLELQAPEITHESSGK